MVMFRSVMYILFSYIWYSFVSTTRTFNKFIKSRTLIHSFERHQLHDDKICSIQSLSNEIISEFDM